MISVDRVAEVIQKYQSLIDVEQDSETKKRMISWLDGMKKVYESLVRANVPCPTELEEEVDKALKVIEGMYNNRIN
jgi:hypothetical protein